MKKALFLIVFISAFTLQAKSQYCGNPMPSYNSWSGFYTLQCNFAWDYYNGDSYIGSNYYTFGTSMYYGLDFRAISTENDGWATGTATKTDQYNNTTQVFSNTYTKFNGNGVAGGYYYWADLYDTIYLQVSSYKTNGYLDLYW